MFLLKLFHFTLFHIGDYNFLTMPETIKLCDEHDAGITTLNPSATGSDQPNDQMKTFHLLHAFAARLKWDDVKRSPCWDEQLKNELAARGIQFTKRGLLDQLLDAMTGLRMMLPNSGTLKVTVDGWVKSGAISDADGHGTEPSHAQIFRKSLKWKDMVLICRYLYRCIYIYMYIYIKIYRYRYACVCMCDCIVNVSY